MSNKIEFAEINEIPLRRFFPGEGTDFTPWLIENIEYLGNAIGIDIIDAEREVKIGDFSLDIQAFESGTERVIAIENQFDKTDHRHLGQLMTYMAGIKANIIVWIAEEFRYEHISAINHLNQISDKNVEFFCIRPRLIKIANSPPSIEFLVIAKPDEWVKDKKPSTQGYTPPITQNEFFKYLDIEGKRFFENLFTFAEEKGLPLHWGRVGFSLNVDLDEKHVSILRGYSNKSNYGQIVGSTFGFIEKFVNDGEKIVKFYRKGLSPFFVSTGPGMKWIIKNIKKEDEEKFYQVLNKVIEMIIEKGLLEDEIKY